MTESNLAEGKWSLATLLRYGIVGVSQNLIAYAVTLGLLAVGIVPWAATAIVYPIATTLSFIGNRYWSFGKRPRTRGQEFRFIAAYIATYPLSVAITSGLVELGTDPRLAVLGSIVASAAVLFVMLTLWVFPKHATSQQRS